MRKGMEFTMAIRGSESYLCQGELEPYPRNVRVSSLKHSVGSLAKWANGTLMAGAIWRKIIKVCAGLFCRIFEFAFAPDDAMPLVNKPTPAQGEADLNTKGEFSPGRCGTQHSPIR